MWVVFWLMSLVNADNLASWIPMTLSANSLNPLPAADICVFPANAIAIQNLHNKIPSIVTSPTDPIFIVNGGFETNPSYAFRFGDIWMLKQTGETEVEWQILAQVNDTTWPVGSDGHEFRQLANGDFLRYGGYDYNRYLSSVWVFKTATLEWVEVQPNGAAGAPDARAWFHMKSIGVLPNGDERFMIFGGEGALNDVPYSLYDQDLSDSYIMTIGKDMSGAYQISWYNPNGNQACLEAGETCLDAATFVDTYSSVTSVYETLVSNLADPVRPQNWQGVLNGVIEELDFLTLYFKGINGTAAAQPPNVRDDSSCTDFCIESTFPPSYPKKRSATRFVRYNDMVVLFGGYSCTAYGSFSAGGPVCFDNVVYIYHISTNHWTNVTQPDASEDPEQNMLWPGGRAYHTLELHADTVFIIGGGFLSDAGVAERYNDVNIFNLTTLRFETPDIRGTPPHIRWDASSFVNGDDLWYFFGDSTTTNFFNDVWILSIGRSVEAINCRAWGSQLAQPAVAGNATTFYIQTTIVTSQNGSNIEWGSALDWGVGLTEEFDVRFVSTVAPTPSNGLIGTEVFLTLGKVTEAPQKGGLYFATFNPTFGPQVSVFVSFNGVGIPGSPFVVSVEADPVPVGAKSYTVDNNLVSIRNELNVVLVQVTDVYGNPTQNRDAIITVSSGSPNNMLASSTTYLDKGIYEVTFTAPDTDQVTLYLRVNGQDIIGSPFQVPNYEQLGVKTSARDAMMAIAAVAMAVVVVLMCSVVYYRDDTAFKAATPIFIETTLVGALLALGSIFAFAKQSDMACRAFPFTLGVAFVVMLGALYIKTWRLMIIFRQKQMKIITISLWRMASYLCVLVTLEIGFNLAWIISAPPHLTTMIGSPAPRSYFECDGENFTIWQLASFVYKGMFLFYGIFLAVMTRKLPTSFNESAWIGLSIYNVAFSVVIVLPVVYGGETQDNLTAVFVITCVAIIWAVLFIACALVLPKIYQIVFNPQETAGTHTPPQGLPPVAAAPSVPSRNSIGTGNGVTQFTQSAISETAPTPPAQIRGVKPVPRVAEETAPNDSSTGGLDNLLLMQVGQQYDKTTVMSTPTSPSSVVPTPQSPVILISPGAQTVGLVLANPMSPASTEMTVRQQQQATLQPVTGSLSPKHPIG